MLRVVNYAQFVQGTNDNPLGVAFVPLPANWDTMSPTEQEEWKATTADGIVPPPASRIVEVVDADLPDYQREFQR